jgi:hypothetical protein
MSKKKIKKNYVIFEVEGGYGELCNSFGVLRGIFGV